MRVEEQIKICSETGFDQADSQAWYQKYAIQRQSAQQRGIGRDLSFREYLNLANQAGLTKPDQIGRSAEQFHLSRHGDAGNYTTGNCRFITARENHFEAIQNGTLDRHHAAMIGQTKETSERVRKMAQKKTGRTKENDQGRAAQADKLAKEFVLRAPDGTVHRGKNVVEFCKQHNLDQANLAKVLSGKRPSHKQWTGFYTSE
jgi:hypothetical protein